MESTKLQDGRQVPGGQLPGGNRLNRFRPAAAWRWILAGSLGLGVVTTALGLGWSLPYVLFVVSLSLAAGFGLAGRIRPAETGIYERSLLGLAGLVAAAYLVAGWPRVAEPVSRLVELGLLAVTVLGLLARPALRPVAAALDLLAADLALFALLAPRPFPLGGPGGLSGPLVALGIGIWLQQLLGGGTVASFLLAVLNPRERRQRLGAGLLFLLPQPFLGIWLSLALEAHLTGTWAMLMGGGAAEIWLVTTLLTVSLLVMALLGLAESFGPGRGFRYGAAVLAIGLIGLLVWGGRVMVPDFARHTLQAALLTGLLGFGLGGLPRRLALWLLPILLFGVGLPVLVGMTMAGAAAARPYLAKAGAMAPPSLPGPRGDLPAERFLRGREAAEYLGCFTCHGTDGRADRPNPGAGGARVPAWSSRDFALVFDAPRSPERLYTVLVEGQNAFRKRYYPRGGSWSVAYRTRDNRKDVPAWGGMLDPGDLADLIYYLRHLAPAEGT